jgi:hypothetical protein
MTLLYKSYQVPSSLKGLKAFLHEIADYLNGLGEHAVGNVEFNLHSEEPEKWTLDVEGKISDGHDENGIEIWKSTELQSFYTGHSAKDAVEKMFLDFKVHYLTD